MSASYHQELYYIFFQKKVIIFCKYFLFSSIPPAFIVVISCLQHNWGSDISADKCHITATKLMIITLSETQQTCNRSEQIVALHTTQLLIIKLEVLLHNRYFVLAARCMYLNVYWWVVAGVDNWIKISFITLLQTPATSPCLWNILLR